jgi:hypothetical protein
MLVYGCNPSHITESISFDSTIFPLSLSLDLMQSNRQERSTVYVRPVRNSKYGEEDTRVFVAVPRRRLEDKTLQQQQQQ